MNNANNNKMKNSKLTTTQKIFVETLKEYTIKTGHGFTAQTNRARTIESLIKKGVIKLVESPFCKGNELVELI